MTQAAIELEGVSKHFGPRVAVSQLDLAIPSGSLYGFIGPNGSGKTTTLRMILRILLPSAGRVVVLGAERASAADNRTGYLPEERGLYRRMRVADVLALFARLKGVRRPERAVDKWLERLGLVDRAAERVESLSKGLSQRVQFAAAVVHDPLLVILDEPFSGLDPVSTDALRETILELRRGGTTVVLSTHDMAVAERMCDAVMMIYRGHKVLDGPVEQVTGGGQGQTVRVRFAQDVPTLSGLAGVVEQRDYGREHALVLAPGRDTQALLGELMTRGQVIKFEVGRPSLHEVFVSIAGEGAPPHADTAQGGPGPSGQEIAGRAREGREAAHV